MRSGPPMAGMIMKLARSFRHPDKTDGASIRRKGWADVISRVRGQPLGLGEPISLM